MKYALHYGRRLDDGAFLIYGNGVFTEEALLAHGGMDCVALFDPKHPEKPTQYLLRCIEQKDQTILLDNHVQNMLFFNIQKQYQLANKAINVPAWQLLVSLRAEEFKYVTFDSRKALETALQQSHHELDDNVVVEDETFSLDKGQYVEIKNNQTWWQWFVGESNIERIEHPNLFAWLEAKQAVDNAAEYNRTVTRAALLTAVATSAGLGGLYWWYSRANAQIVDAENTGFSFNADSGAVTTVEDFVITPKSPGCSHSITNLPASPQLVRPGIPFKPVTSIGYSPGSPCGDRRCNDFALTPSNPAYFRNAAISAITGADSVHLCPTSSRKIDMTSAIVQIWNDQTPTACIESISITLSPYSFNQSSFLELSARICKGGAECEGADDYCGAHPIGLNIVPAEIGMRFEIPNVRPGAYVNITNGLSVAGGLLPGEAFRVTTDPSGVVNFVPNSEECATIGQIGDALVFSKGESEEAIENCLNSLVAQVTNETLSFNFVFQNVYQDDVLAQYLRRVNVAPASLGWLSSGIARSENIAGGHAIPYRQDAIINPIQGRSGNYAVFGGEQLEVIATNATFTDNTLASCAWHNVTSSELRYDKAMTSNLFEFCLNNLEVKSVAETFSITVNQFASAGNLLENKTISGFKATPISFDWLKSAMAYRLGEPFTLFDGTNIFAQTLDGEKLSLSVDSGNGGVVNLTSSRCQWQKHNNSLFMQEGMIPKALELCLTDVKASTSKDSFSLSMQLYSNYEMDVTLMDPLVFNYHVLRLLIEASKELTLDKEGTCKAFESLKISGGMLPGEYLTLKSPYHMDSFRTTGCLGSGGDSIVLIAPDDPDEYVNGAYPSQKIEDCLSLLEFNPAKGFFSLYDSVIHGNPLLNVSLVTVNGTHMPLLKVTYHFNNYNYGLGIIAAGSTGLTMFGTYKYGAWVKRQLGFHSVYHAYKPKAADKLAFLFDAKRTKNEDMRSSYFLAVNQLFSIHSINRPGADVSNREIAVAYAILSAKWKAQEQGRRFKLTDHRQIALQNIAALITDSVDELAREIQQNAAEPNSDVLHYESVLDEADKMYKNGLPVLNRKAVESRLSDVNNNSSDYDSETLLAPSSRSSQFVGWLSHLCSARNQRGKPLLVSEDPLLGSDFDDGSDSEMSPVGSPSRQEEGSSLSEQDFSGSPQQP